MKIAAEVGRETTTRWWVQKERPAPSAARTLGANRPVIDYHIRAANSHMRIYTVIRSCLRTTTTTFFDFLRYIRNGHFAL